MTTPRPTWTLRVALGLALLAASSDSAGADRPSSNRFAYLNEPDAAYASSDLPQRIDSAWNATTCLGEKVVVDLSRVGSRVDLVRAELERFNRRAHAGQVLRIAPVDRRSWTVVDLEADGFLDLIEDSNELPDIKPSAADPEKGAGKPKVVPQNAPATVTAEPNSGLRLLATMAELYGREGPGTIAVYDAQMCIGWWNHEGDHAVWAVDAPRTGPYDVQFNWSIPDEMAGNRFALEAGPHRLVGSIPSTGGFEHFRRAKFGTLWLEKGKNRVRLRSLGLINGELADLKEIHLTTPDDAKPSVSQDVAVGRVWQWSPDTNKWRTTPLPTTADVFLHAAARWGVVGAARLPTVLVRTAAFSEAWQFDRGRWTSSPQLLRGLELEGRRVFTATGGRDTGVRLLDLDGDGSCELIVANPAQSAIWSWSAADEGWRRLPARLPEGVTFVDAQGRDAGLRFVDVDGDVRLDVVFSNEQRYAVHLFQSLRIGWSAAIVGDRRHPDSAVDQFPCISVQGVATGVGFDRTALRIRGALELPPSTEKRSGSADSVLAQSLAQAELARKWRRSQSSQSAPSAALDRLQPAAAQNGFAKLVHNDGGTDTWHSYRGDSWRQHFVRQQTADHRLEWETAALTSGETTDHVQLVFAGALGYQTEPRTAGFTLLVNDQAVLDFDVALEPTLWSSSAEPISLLYFPTWRNAVDSAGFFYLALPAKRVQNGKSLRLAVHSKGTGSLRWFALPPVTNAISLQRPLAVGLTGDGPQSASERK